MTDRKPSPLWPLLTAALVGLPVLYVASFGPACGLVTLKLLAPQFMIAVYRPFLIEAAGSQRITDDALWFWADCWGGRIGLENAEKALYGDLWNP